MTLIKDLEFTPRFTDKEYDKCITFFSEGMKRDYDCCTKFIIVSDTDQLANPMAACHAAIGYHSVISPSLVGTEIALTRRKLQDCEGAWQFLDWMLNDSFASRFIVNKTEHRTLEWVANNGIIVSTDVIQPLFQMIMIFSRSHSERSATQFTKWKEMVDDGFDPHFAYQACMCIGAGGSAHMQSFPAEHVVTTRTSHTTTYLLNMECMKKFCEGDLGLRNYETELYRNKRSVHGCHDLFQGNIGAGYTLNFIKDLFANDPEFVTRMKVFRNEATSPENYRPPNPFTRVAAPLTKAPDQVTHQEYFEVVIPYMKEKGLFYNAPKK